jgi:hypothetical protein
MTARTAGKATVAGVLPRVWAALALASTLGLAGCADVDEMMFGGNDASEGSHPVTAYQAPAPTAVPATTSAQSAPIAGNVAAPVATVTPLTIEPGSDTGTAVSKTTASLREKVVELQGAIRQNAQQLTDLRNSGAGAAVAYHASKANITTRLQIGTTRGNPELVSEWNVAQSYLDQLSTNINGLNALAKAAATDTSTAHYTLDQINATLNVSGAVDEDHRQLRVLEDETDQTVVLLDRLLREVSEDVQRQTAYVANERANLTTLASAIKNGELYGADISTPMIMAGAPVTGSASAPSSAPLVVIRFDHADVDYQQILYAALRQTLQVRPNAGFSVVAVSPTRGTATAVQLAQTAAHRHAQEVLRTMTDMGVPASRLSVASSTDPAAMTSEVRVFVR